MAESAVKRWILHIILALTLLFMLAPILIVIVNSFNASAFNVWPPQHFTLDWYRKVLGDRGFQTGMVNSMIVGVASTAVVLVVGLPIAWALARLRAKGFAAIRIAIFSPLVVPRVAIGFSVFVLFITLGTLTGVRLYGTYSGIILAHSMVMLPFVVTILVASLGEVDPIVEEAARDLGATSLQTFFLAVLPQIKGALVIAAVLAFITSFDEVEITIFIVKPAVNTLPIELYHHLEQYQDPSIAAISTLLIAFTFMLAFIIPFMIKGSELLRMMTSGRS